VNTAVPPSTPSAQRAGASRSPDQRSADDLRRLRTEAPAPGADSEKLYGLLLEASAWLRGKGLRQWNPVYPRERFPREIEAGHVWHWAFGGEPIATVTLLERRPEYYPRGIWEDGLRAWYVCRFTVSRTLAGRRIGERLLEVLEADAVDKGVRVLRLDVVSSNPFLEDLRDGPRLRTLQDG